MNTMDSGADEELGLSAPLIPQQTASATDVADSDEAEATKADVPLLPAVGTALLAVGGLAATVAAMISAPTALVFVAGLVCVVNSPWIAVNQIRIFKHGVLRRVIDRMKTQLKSLRKSLHILEASVDDMIEEVECLQEMEQALDGVVREQGSSADEFVLLLRENESILKKMRNILRERALADVTKLVLISDTDENMTIDLRELDTLTLKVKLTLSADGIDLDEDKFKAMIRKDNDISHVVQVIAAIMFKESIDGQEFNEYAEDAIQEEMLQEHLIGTSMAVRRAAARFRRIASSAGDKPPRHSIQDDPAISLTLARAVGQFGRLARATRDAETDGMPMFSVQEVYTKGSVDSARHRRTSLSNKNGRLSRGEAMRGMIQGAMRKLDIEDEHKDEEGASPAPTAEDSIWASNPHIGQSKSRLKIPRKMKQLKNKLRKWAK